MRLMPIVLTTITLAVAGSLFAQEWVEFASREDRFTCLFPTQPKVMETTYQSQHEANLPARVYTAAQGKSTFKVTVVDYNQARPILTEKAKSCPAGAEPCLGGPGDEGHWHADIRGAIDWETWQLLKRDAKVTLVDISVEDAAKIILSAGMVNPDSQARLKQLAEAAKRPAKEQAKEQAAVKDAPPPEQTMEADPDPKSSPSQKERDAKERRSKIVSR